MTMDPLTPSPSGWKRKICGLDLWRDGRCVASITYNRESKSPTHPWSVSMGDPGADTHHPSFADAKLLVETLYPEVK